VERSCRESITDVDSVKAVERAIRDGEPGRYHLHEISAEPLLSGHTSRWWGTVIQRLDGAVTLVPDPLPNRRLTASPRSGGGVIHDSVSARV
jgi:hypothetical protein